jgi:catechol 2,3-dioxygenase-like lactoylglutathione lyase family enzyme
MTAQLNHTIVYSSDRAKSARFLAEILGLPTPVRFGPFEVVELDNGVSLDFAAADGPIQPQHYAFLISEADFDAVFGRIREQGLQYWADPGRPLSYLTDSQLHRNLKTPKFFTACM